MVRRRFSEQELKLERVQLVKFKHDSSNSILEYFFSIIQQNDSHGTRNKKSPTKATNIFEYDFYTTIYYWNSAANKSMQLPTIRPTSEAEKLNA
jgi:hypothetical protein